MIPAPLHRRLSESLAQRAATGLLRNIPAHPETTGILDLTRNDYLALARDPALIAAAQEAAEKYGCSASASPLLGGHGALHRELEHSLCRWHEMPHALVWTSGYTANQAVLSTLPQKGDLVFADRLAHRSMWAGITRSPAKLVRFRHNDIGHLRERLRETILPENGTRFVVTESVFSMDGDSPDLSALAALKAELPFCLVLDEAHALGWFGADGSGLAKQSGFVPAVDILVGTLGKGLASQGAYTLFHDPVLREFLVNQAPEFIYSTYLSPLAAAVALAAMDRARALASTRPAWHALSQTFRARLRDRGWQVPDGLSPIVPVTIGNHDKLLEHASRLRAHGILAAAVRPPTVPPGSARLRFSLHRGLGEHDLQRVAEALGPCPSA